MRSNRRNQIIFSVLLVLSASLLAACGNANVEGLTTDTAGQSGVMLFTIFQDATGATMTNASTAGTEITNNVSRTYFDFTGYTEVRAQFTSSLTSATVRCRIEYSLDDGTSWSVLVPNFSALTVANSNSKSDWGAIPDWALQTVLIRAVIVGDGVLDPVVRYVRVEVR